MLAEDEGEGLADRGHRGGGEVGFAIEGGVASGEEEGVALARGDIEDLGEGDDHLAARLGAPGFDEADVARGDVGLQGEVELAHPASGTPVAEERADLGFGDGGAHWDSLSFAIFCGSGGGGGGWRRGCPVQD